jgi:hypothetical protein
MGPRVEIGAEGTTKTLYATGEVSLGDDDRIWGWAISESGGHVR